MFAVSDKQFLIAWAVIVRITAHKDKEQLIWEEFKERLGKSEFTRFGIDPATILERREDLDFLEESFSVMVSWKLTQW